MNAHTIRLTAAALGLAGLATFGTAIAASAATPAPAPAASVVTTDPGPGDPGLAGRPASAGGPILSVAQADQELGGTPAATGTHGPGDPGLAGRPASAGGPILSVAQADQELRGTPAATTVLADVQWTQLNQVILADLGQGSW